MTRAEHLAWCKQRATEYVDRGDVDQAWTSIVSDLGKHEGTAGHAAIGLGYMLYLDGHLSRPDQMRKFIDGFN